MKRWSVITGPWEGFTGMEIGRSESRHGVILELFDGGTRRLYVNLSDCRLVVGEVV